VLILSSYSCGPTRLRLAFPTRRSSDLSVVFTGLLVLLQAVLVGISWFAIGTGVDPTVRFPDAALVLPSTSGIWGATAFALALLLDRKSTRLNSSHVKLSYAVFCLTQNS